VQKSKRGAKIKKNFLCNLLLTHFISRTSAVKQLIFVLRLDFGYASKPEN
jgi:hypothetical protein